MKFIEWISTKEEGYVFLYLTMSFEQLNKHLGILKEHSSLKKQILDLWKARDDIKAVWKEDTNGGFP